MTILREPAWRQRIALGLLALVATGYAGWVARAGPPRAGQSCAAGNEAAPGQSSTTGVGGPPTHVGLVFTEDGSHFMAPSARDAAGIPPRFHWLLPRFPVFAVTVTGNDGARAIRCAMVYEDAHWQPAAIAADVLASQHRS